MPSPRPVAGKPLVVYMGDDSRGEYIYKFVSNAQLGRRPTPARATAWPRATSTWTTASCTWPSSTPTAPAAGSSSRIANAAIAGYATYAFADQADVLVNARLAADAVGATKMDRPEWGARATRSPARSTITLTNNSNRRLDRHRQPAASTPPTRAPTRDTYDGSARHARATSTATSSAWREDGGEPAATSFTWDVYLFGAAVRRRRRRQRQPLRPDRRQRLLQPRRPVVQPEHTGLCWIQTDDGAYTDVTNCMMLAARARPGGRRRRKTTLSYAEPTAAPIRPSPPTSASQPAADTLRRFLVGPKGCEITGITETPDGKALFVNIQHPGETTRAANIGRPGQVPEPLARQRRLRRRWRDGPAAFGHRS